jgi:hypothetical protein
MLAFACIGRPKKPCKPLFLTEPHRLNLLPVSGELNDLGIAFSRHEADMAGSQQLAVMTGKKVAAPGENPLKQALPYSAL